MLRIIALLVFLYMGHALACGTTSEVLLTSAKLISTSGTNLCTWKYKAPTGQKIVLDCYPFAAGLLNIKCFSDKVTVNGKTFCGRTFNKLTTVANTIEIVSSGTVSMKCTVTPMPDPCDCGRRLSTYIVGGTTAGVNEFPYQAALYDSTNTNLQCGATIIDDEWIMTAAHCVAGQTASDFTVRVGEHDRSTTTETDATASYKVLNVITHPDYDPASSVNPNDIALLRVSKIALNDKVGVACLPFKYADNQFPSDGVTTAGWGTLEQNGPTSNTLQKVDLNTITNAECEMSYPMLSSATLCTYTPDKDTCQYDSGSGLHYMDGGRAYAVGIVSGGRSCAGAYPALNTRVTSMLPWIKMTATTATFCDV